MSRHLLIIVCANVVLLFGCAPAPTSHEQSASSSASSIALSEFYNTRYQYRFQYPSTEQPVAAGMVGSAPAPEKSNDITVGGVHVVVYDQAALKKCAESFKGNDKRFVGKALPEFATELWHVNMSKNPDEQKYDRELRPLTETMLGGEAAYAFLTIHGDEDPCSGMISGGERRFIVAEYHGRMLILSYNTRDSEMAESIVATFHFDAGGL